MILWLTHLELWWASKTEAISTEYRKKNPKQFYEKLKSYKINFSWLKSPLDDKVMTINMYIFYYLTHTKSPSVKNVENPVSSCQTISKSVGYFISLGAENVGI